MKKLKHSKYKNTGIIFEILSRNIVNEVLNKKNSVSLGMVKRYFSEGTELYKELKYYQTLQEINKKIRRVDSLIDVVIESYGKTINHEKLASEKYRLIGEIKKHYDFETFFNSRVSNYKLLASVYKILEHSVSDNPGDYMNCRDVIAEHISGEDQNENILTEVQTVWKTENPDIKRLAQKIVVEKFNSKYHGLGSKQKALLKKFIHEDVESTSFRDYVYGEVSNLKTKLTRISNGIQNKVMQIKLMECINLMDIIVSSKSVKNEHLSSMLKYYELVEELS
jgi:hypothetical protein